MDKISVIVPVWNAHDYLERCVDSILGQTYTNIELLLVDDGSSDDSFAICERYAKQDNRVRVFRKENGGQASARNYALDRATGDFIGFVDNDDWIFPTMYERLHQLIVNCGADVARCADMQGEIEASPSAEEANVQILEGQELFGLLYQDILGGHVTDRLFRRELIGDERFPHSKTIEDMRFIRLILPKIKKEVSTDEKLFFYTIREDNASKVHARSHVNAYERACEFQSRYAESLVLYPQYSDLLLNKATYFTCSAMLALLKAKKKKTEEYIEGKQFLQMHKRSILSLDKLKYRFKVFVLLMG